MRLVQKRSAAVLAAGLIAVPALPVLVAALTPADDWRTVESGHALVAFSANGAEISVLPPPGWQYREVGDAVVLRSGTGSSAQVRVFDREGRDPDAMAQRVIRSDRIVGADAAIVAGTVAAADGTLRGRRCTIVIEDLSGTCAFLSDADVLVAIDTVGSADQPALPLEEMLARVHRTGQ